MADTSTGFGGYTTAILPDVGMTMQQFDATVAQKQQEFDFKFTDVNPQELVQLSQLTYNINGALSDQGDALRIKLVSGETLTPTEQYFLAYQANLTPPVYRPTYGSNPNAGPISWKIDNNVLNLVSAPKTNTLQGYNTAYDSGFLAGSSTSPSSTVSDIIDNGAGGITGSSTGGTSGASVGSTDGTSTREYTATTNGIPSSAPNNILDAATIARDKQELSNLIYKEFQKDFEEIKKRVSHPESLANRDLAEKLSAAMVEFLDTTYWQRMGAYIESRIVAHTHNLI